MNMTTPEAACGRFPLKGATPVAGQSPIHGVRWFNGTMRHGFDPPS